MTEVKRISLWSGPRNISTALMYSFAQRPDTQVVDEPLYGYFLKNFEARAYHPGADEVMRTMECDGEKVIREMTGGNHKPVLFFKNMVHHLQGLDRAFLKSLVNIILTRHPEEMLPSYAAVIERPTIEDVGYRAHVELLEFLQKEKIPVVVLDAKSVLMNPELQLKKLCDFAGIPFYDEMLRWEAGARPEDGSWAPFWYANVHQSTGFGRYKPKNQPFPEHLKPLLGECMPYYEQLLALSV
ncbi:MAG: sulfotransferase family protein [Cryomorphaceae bacterium]|nr:MAG: sulfotransferase family protein [Cryomorphaceae bacterium]